MTAITEMLALILGIAGAVEISYVESRIVARGMAGIREGDPLRSRYWTHLTVAERCLFWTGLPLLVAPFIMMLAF